jgi:uncharacterized protein
MGLNAAGRAAGMIRVEIANVFLTQKGDEFIVLLRSAEDERTLPISIGQLEAQSIAIQLYHVSFPRPLTHDLFKSAIERLGGKVSKVVINDLTDNTFYGRLFIEMKDETIEVDSRPSDALALALRFSAPIFVEEKVLEEAGVIMPAEMKDENKPQEEPAEPARQLSPVEQLKRQLGKAILEERYEDAAHLRDEINKITKLN